jgi:4-hydroxy-tetrahydrodipicolinate synthase
VSGLQGVQAAAITPRGKNGEIDFGAAFELIDHLCRGGASGILLFGPTGEYPAFPAEDRARLVKLGMKRSHVPVLAGVGASTIDESLELADAARDAGAEGIVVPAPYFFRYDQDDLRAFFCHFAAEAGDDPPLYLYRTAALETETAIELWESGRYAGVVDATGEIDALERLIETGVAAVTGHDAAAGHSGGRGMVSAAACAVPELAAALDQALASGSVEEARENNRKLQEFVRWAACFPEPVAVKLATGLRGLKTGPLAVPLSPRKQKELEAFRTWFLQWLPTVWKCGAHG